MNSDTASALPVQAIDMQDAPTFIVPAPPSVHDADFEDSDESSIDSDFGITKLERKRQQHEDDVRSLEKKLIPKEEEHRRDAIDYNESAVEKIKDLKLDVKPVVEEVPKDMPPMGLYACYLLGMNLSSYVISLRKNRMSAIAKELVQCNVTPRQCAIIAKFGLAFNSSVEVFDISSEHTISIGDKGCRMLFRCLQYNDRLVSLTLSYNDISDAAMPLVRQLLMNNKSLCHLNLAHNNVQVDGVQIIMDTLGEVPCPMLVSLDLQHNPLGDAAATCIANMLKNNYGITELNVSNCMISNLGAIEIFTSMQQNKTLTSLDLHGTDLDDNGALPNIDTAGAKALGGRLGKTNEALKWLNISGFKLPVDKLVDSRWVQLQNCNLTEIDALLMSAILPKNNKLQCLSLEGNKLQRWGVLELLESIMLLPQLKSVNLSNNGLFEEVGMFIGNLFDTYKTQMEQFTVANITLNVQELVGNTSVTEFEFNDSELSPLDRIILAALLSSNLNAVRLNTIFIAEDATEWNIVGTKHTIYELSFIFARVGRHRRIEKLVVNSSGLNAESAAYLAQNIRNHGTLKKLVLENNSLFAHGGNEIGDAMLYNKSITFLDLSWNKITNYGLHLLASAMKTNDSLEELYLRGNELSSVGIAPLFDGLLKNVRLHTISLCWNSICDQCGIAIGKCLEQNRALTHIDLEQQYMSAKGFSAIAYALRQNKIIKLLNVLGDYKLYPDAKGFGVEGAGYIGRILQTNLSITSLSIGDNKLRTEGCAVIAKAIKHDKILKSLNLSRSSMDPLVSKIFFPNITHHPCLTELNLSHNRIGVEGTRPMIAMLTKNTILVNLNLQCNEIHEEALAMIASNMDDFSPTLLRVCLIDNRGSARTCERLRWSPPPLQIEI